VAFFSPTKELSAKTAAKEVAGQVPCRLFNEDTVGKGNVTAKLVEHFKKPSELTENLVFATHATLPLIPFIANKRRTHVIVDEEIQAIQYACHRLPIMHPLITDDIQLEPYNSIYSRIVPPRHWFNYVNTEQYERLRRGDSQTLAFHSILSPAIVEGFASVFMTAANFEATMLYQLWGVSNGAEDAPLASQPSFFRDDGFLNSLRFQSHQNGHLLTIYYGMDATNSKKRLEDGGTEADGRNNFDRLIDTTRRLFGEERFVWQANKSYDDNRFGANATRLPNVPHGLNDYADYHNIAFLSALNPTPDHYRFLASVGLDAMAVYNAIYHQALYQSLMRTALRDPDNQQPINAIVPDLAAARYLQSVFDGAKVVKAETGIVEDVATIKKAGRHRKWQDDAERKCQARHEAKEKQIEILNKQLSLIRRLPYMNLDGVVVENESDTTFDTCSKWRPEIGLYYIPKKRTPLRGGVRSSKTQLFQEHTDVFVADYRNLDCCGSIFAHKQAPEPSAYLKWQDEEGYVYALTLAYVRKLGKKTDNYLISPAIFDPTPINGKRRGEVNIVYCRHIVLDFENGDLAPSELPSLFPDLRMVVTNSFSSTKDKPRFRAIILTNQPITAEMYRAIYECTAIKLEDAGYYVGNRKRRGAKKPSGLDWTKRHAASLFYLPCLAKDQAASFFMYYKAARKMLDPVTWLQNTTAEVATATSIVQEITQYEFLSYLILFLF
jgi:hypothetical protein